MKMKHITLIAILFTGLIGLSTNARSKQLFEVVNNELTANSNNNKNPRTEGSLNSLFSATENDKKSSNNEISFAQKSETKSLFSEVDEKQVTKSLFGDNNDSDNSETNKFMNKNNKQNGKSLFEDSKSSKSLFDNDNETGKDSVKQNNKKASISFETKSLFDSENEPIKPQVKLNESIKPKINFPQQKSAPITKNNDNKNAEKVINNSNKYTHSKKNDKKIERKPITNTGIMHKSNIDDKTLQQSKSEIEKLKSKVLNLITINKQLLKELDKKRKIKRKSLNLSDDLINLIETHEKPIVKFEQNLKTTQSKSEEKLKQKETELQASYGQVRKNLDVLVEKLDLTKKALKEVKSDEKLMNGEIKKFYSIDSLNVLNNVQVEESTSSRNVYTESVDIGNIKVDLEKILITNPQTEIIVGSEILSVKELVENLNVLEKLNERCGENLENCVQYNEKHFENDMIKQKEIIEELKVLRKQTKDIINKKY